MKKYDVVWDGTQTRGAGKTKGELLPAYDRKSWMAAYLDRLRTAVSFSRNETTRIRQTTSRIAGRAEWPNRLTRLKRALIAKNRGITLK